MVKTKICSCCHKEKILSEFSKDNRNKDGKYCYCKKCCSIKNKSKYNPVKRKLKYSLNFAKKYFIECGYEPLFNSLEYTGVTVKLKCKCPKHGIFQISLTKLMNGRRCKKCSINKKSLNNKMTKTQIENTRTSNEYKNWRMSVFKRDNFTCNCCGINSNKSPLRAHHILNFSSHINLRYSIENGITMCSKCHKKFHKTYGVKHNSKEQVDEFIISKGR